MIFWTNLSVQNFIVQEKKGKRIREGKEGQVLGRPEGGEKFY